MSTYVVNYTDVNRVPSSISIGEQSEDQSLPIALFGRRKLQYGELMNENILHLLENFACPENELFPGTPDLSVALNNTLSNAIDGQLWYNSTRKLLYVRSAGAWIPLAHLGDVATNSGTISDGEQIPLPVSSSGYEFSYDECHWMVGPHDYTDSISEMICITDSQANVTMRYTTTAGPVVNGVANYLIIGIKNGAPAAPAISTTPSPSVTPTPLVTPTPSPTELPPEVLTWTVTNGTVYNSCNYIICSRPPNVMITWYAGGATATNGTVTGIEDWLSTSPSGNSVNNWEMKYDILSSQHTQPPVSTPGTEASWLPMDQDRTLEWSSGNTWSTYISYVDVWFREIGDTGAGIKKRISLTSERTS